MRTKFQYWLALPLLALTLSACSGEAGGAGTSSQEGAQSGAESSVESDETSSYVDITDQQGSAPEFEGAVEDAEVMRCEAADGGWIAEGTVQNPLDANQDYRIYVAFNKNNDTRGLVQVDLESVAPAGTATWEAHAPISGDDLRCILRVERFASE